MHTFLSFIKEFRIPKRHEIAQAAYSFSKKQFSVFLASIVIAAVLLVVILGKINNMFMVQVPADGGSITEGIIGMPTLINPVLAISDADKDVTALVYSGLMRKTPDGSFIPDLAESYTISPDGMIYTFLLKKDITFHDDTAVTPDDVVFTVEKIKDPLIKSPRKVGWDGVTASKKDDSTVVFTLKQPYISFMDNMTTGILPMHIWKDISAPEFSLSALNIKAIGSGAYKIDSVSKNSDGIPEEYTLKRFREFALGEPHIKSISLVSYANEKDLVRALTSHSIDQASGLSPENANEIEEAGYTIHTATLPRIFGLFFNNANNKILADTAVVHAFDKALDRKNIVDSVLGGYGTVIHSPIPNTILNDDLASSYETSNTEEANTILENAGWKMGEDGIRAKGGTSTVTRTKKVGKKTVTETVKVNNGPITRLSFSIKTGDTPELISASNLIKEELGKIGAEVDIKVYGTGELNQIIRARDYESLFFGQIVNHESDLYSFWHSSQKNDPGLNIAMYSDSKIDSILETAQKTLTRENRLTAYQEFINQFNTKLPAIIVYSPKYLYATSSDLNHVSLDTLAVPSDRFGSAYTWYASKDHVWKIFTK